MKFHRRPSCFFALQVCQENQKWYLPFVGFQLSAGDERSLFIMAIIFQFYSSKLFLIVYVFIFCLLSNIFGPRIFYALVHFYRDLAWKIARLLALVAMLWTAAFLYFFWNADWQSRKEALSLNSFWFKRVPSMMAIYHIKRHPYSF